jgi:hypothetical protein
MKHLEDEHLVSRYYAETEEAAEAHLAACDECRERYQRLQRVLNSVDSLAVPERSANYEEQLWQKVAPQVATRARRSWLERPALRFALAAGVLIAVFFAGWTTRTKVAPPDHDAVLALAVGEHLERAQLILAQLANDENQRDIAYERDTAEELLQVNRLYRQAAQLSGDQETADMLDGLERALAEIAHTPNDASVAELRDLRQEIRGQGILVQVRSFETKLRAQL